MQSVSPLEWQVLWFISGNEILLDEACNNVSTDGHGLSPIQGSGRASRSAELIIGHPQQRKP